jgi:hypothetical protein
MTAPLGAITYKELEKLITEQGKCYLVLRKPRDSDGGQFLSFQLNSNTSIVPCDEVDADFTLLGYTKVAGSQDDIRGVVDLMKGDPIVSTVGGRLFSNYWLAYAYFLQLHAGKKKP